MQRDSILVLTARSSQVRYAVGRIVERGVRCSIPTRDPSSGLRVIGSSMSERSPVASVAAKRSAKRVPRRPKRYASSSASISIAGGSCRGRRSPIPPGCVIAVEVDKSFIRESACMTISQAAQALGITRGRASQLAKSGLLDSVEVDGKRMVTIASVNERKANPPAPHRPRGQ